MMTREEAIELLEERKKFNRTMQHGWEQSEGITVSGKTVNTASFSKQHKDEADAIDIALTALHPVSREQVEKLRGEWIPAESDFDDDDTLFDVEDWCDWQCSACHNEVCYDDPMERRWLPKFCPNCGAPMTDEAVEMVMERLEALKDGKGD